MRAPAPTDTFGFRQFPGKFCRFCPQVLLESDGQTAVRKTCEQICKICPQVLTVFVSWVLPPFSHVSNLLTIAPRTDLRHDPARARPDKDRGPNDGQ